MWSVNTQQNQVISHTIQTSDSRIFKNCGTVNYGLVPNFITECVGLKNCNTPLLFLFLAVGDNQGVVLKMRIQNVFLILPVFSEKTATRLVVKNKENGRFFHLDLGATF